MPRRMQFLATNEYYHVFNRSVGHEIIFENKVFLRKILELVDYYRYPQTLKFSAFKNLPSTLKNVYISNFKKQTPLIEIYSYAFMPNHYHLLLKQLINKGILKFISNLQNSFAKYINIKTDRHGSLFQNPFKAKRIETDEEFLHISRYIHLNPVTSYRIEYKDLVSYPWTSFSWYYNDKFDTFVNTKEILNRFRSKDEYFSFHEDQVDYQKHLGLIKHLLVD